MKKRNFITGFSAAFAALMILASCGGIRAKDGVVLTINGKEYTAEDLYGDQKTPAAAEAKFNAVYKVAIRRYFEEGNDGHQYMEEITRDTKNKISGSKAEAQSNADKNKTSYDTEWDKILSSNNVEDEDELYDKYEYELEKTKFEDVFYDKKYKVGDEEKTNYDVLRNGGLFKDENGKGWGDEKTENQLVGYLNEKQPYHIKHILIKISGGKQTGDDTDCLITREEANKLYNVIKELVEGKDFEEVSDTWNEDDSAKSNHASLGIMSRDTSFVNDFKLGIYLYEAAYGSSTSKDTGETGFKSKQASDKLFGVTDWSSETTTTGTAADYAKKILTDADLKDPTNSDTVEKVTGENYLKGLGQIPYGEVEKLALSDSGGYGDYDAKREETINDFKSHGVDVSKVKEKYFPRNVIFNKYFNKHKIMVITPRKAPSDFGTGVDYLKFANNTVTRNTGADIYTLDEESTYESKTGFSRNDTAKNDDIISINNGNNKILRDENGRAILVFRSGTGSNNESNDSGYQGIHFVVIERSPFIGEEEDKNGSTTLGKTSLDEYYTEYYPEQIGGNHPTYTRGDTDYKKTFTHFINYSKTEDMKKRADTVKSELKKADDNLNTYVYDYLVKKGNITFNQSSDKAKALESSINSWINDTKRNNTKYEKEKKWDETWATYYWNLKGRAQSRKHETGKVSRLIPEICVNAFVNPDTALKAYTGGTEHTCTLAEIFGEGGAFNE